MQSAETLLQAIEEVYDNVNLKEKPNYNQAEDLLIKMRNTLYT
ncbi:hypothetical protein [Flavobacterium columnare]|nr:hypothetical protein [Flavobacterium columnare]